MKLEYRDPKTLTPHPRNSRRHTGDQITALGRAMLEFGFHQPVVITPEGVILVGHARTLAAIDVELGQIPVVVAHDLTEPQERALIIADNRLHELGAGWNEKILNDELLSLMNAGVDITLTGFEPVEAVPTRKSPDEENVAPPVEDVAISKAGDVWNLDGHVLMVGDATNAAAVSGMLDLCSPNVMVTDPPYGVEYDPAWRNEAMRADGQAVGARAVGKVQNDDKADWAAVYGLFRGAVAYVWHAGVYSAEVARGLVATGFDLRAQIAWRKSRLVIGRGAYHWQHEPCWYAVRKGGKVDWRGGREQTTVWEIEHLKSGTGHGTQKPVDAMRIPMLNHTAPGEFVFDPFLGSGTSIIAAESCARKVCGCEIDPLYADVIVRRWQAYADKHAHHWEDGRTFAEVEQERGSS